MDSLAKMALQLGAIASKVEGAKDIYVEQVGGQPQVVVKYNRSKMALHGIRTETLNQALETAFAGATAGQIYEDEKRFDLVVRLDAKNRSNLEDVSELPIKTESGQILPLKELATVSLIDGPNQIQRENAQRRITVGFNVRGADVQTVVEALQLKVNQQMRLPAGYSLHYGGSFENLQSAKSRLAIAIPVALLLIWMLLYFAFRSVQYSLIIFSAIPLSLIGGIWGLLLRDMPFSISAGIGMIALFGVAVLNGIVLLAEFRRHPSPSTFDELKQQVVHSTLTRLRPVLMTALVAALGFMPMALSHGAGAEVQKPLATVVIGGLITATLLTLLLLPTLYIALEKRKFKFTHTKTMVTLLLMTLGLWGTSAHAQTSPTSPRWLTLEQALDSAVQHNKQLRQYRYLTASAEQQALSKLSLEPLSISMERGQVNSWYQDQKVGVSQAIAMPQYYRAEYRIRKSMSEAMRYRYGMKELEIKQSVAMLYHHLQHTREQFGLWRNLDSMAVLNLGKIELRLKQGDADALEVNDAKKVAADIHMRYKQLLQLYESDALELGAWTGLGAKVYPLVAVSGAEGQSPSLLSNFGALNLSDLPAKGLAHANVEMSYQAWQLARAQRLPYLQVGWVQQSFQGYQQLPSGDQFFGRELQFSQYQLGLRVPVVGGGYRRKAAGLKMDYQAATFAEQFVDEQAQLRYEQLKMALAFWDEQMQQYKDVLLPAANEQLRLLSLRRDQGEISGLAYGVYLRDAMQTQIDYYQTVHEWESVQLELQYFNPNIQ
jgi:cobalt-zinc-cadmium resistance protein CzcA